MVQAAGRKAGEVPKVQDEVLGPAAKGAAMKSWEVPYERTCRGRCVVEAETAEEAWALVASGEFDSDPGEEQTDWKAAGRARENA